MKAALALLVLVGTASAEPRKCKPAGRVLFEIDQRADPGHKLVTATTKLFGNGAWQTAVADVDGEPMRATSGCLDSAQVDGLRDDLKGAKWQVTHTNNTCSPSPRFTVYKAGARTHTERTCSGDALDANTQHALDRIAIWVRVPDLDGTHDRRKRGISQDCLDNPLAKGCT